MPTARRRSRETMMRCRGGGEDSRPAGKSGCDISTLARSG